MVGLVPMIALRVTDDSDDEEDDLDGTFSSDEDELDITGTDPTNDSSLTPRASGSRKMRFITKEGDVTCSGVNRSTVPRKLKRNCIAYKQLSNEMKIAMSWIKGNLPGEEPLLKEAASQGRLYCVGCDSYVANRSDRLLVHLKRDTHRDVVKQKGRRVEPIAVPKDHFFAKLSKTSRGKKDYADDIYAAVAVLMGSGINPHQISSFTAPMLQAILRLVERFGPLHPRKISNIGCAAPETLLDREIKAAVSPPNARYYLVVDGSSTSLADGKKVVLVNLIVPGKVFLLEPTLSEKVMSAEGYAGVIRGHMEKYHLSKKKTVCIFTDGWSGNSKLANVLGLKNGQCQSHKFDLVAKVLHKTLSLDTVPHVFNRIILLHSVRAAFRKRNLRVSLYRTQDHRFHHLGPLFKDLEENKDMVLDALREVLAESPKRKHGSKRHGSTSPAAAIVTSPAAAESTTSAEPVKRKRGRPPKDKDDAASTGKRKPSASPDTGMQRSIKRQKKSHGDTGSIGAGQVDDVHLEEGSPVPASAPPVSADFIRQTTYEIDYGNIEFLIEFLTSGLELVRIRFFNMLMEPVMKIIKSSEADPNNAPCSFRKLVEDFQKNIQRYYDDPDTIIQFMLARTKTPLSTQKILVPKGKAVLVNGVEEISPCLVR